MRVLSIVLGFESPRLVEEVLLAENCADILSGSSLCLVGNTQAVGSHVGYESDRADPCNINTFVKFLSGFHGTLCTESEFLGSLLLERGSNERWRRLFLGKALFHRFYCIICTFKTCKQSVSLSLIRYLKLFSVYRNECRIENLSRTRRCKFRVNRPVLFGNKCAYLVFPVHDKLYRNRLNSPCRKSSLDLFPQKRTKLIAHKTVKDTSCLLCVYKVDINFVRIVHSVLNASFGDLVECNTVVFGHIKF